ncbi:MAG: right-handed parallel beta-helix repeat-containing protein [Xanthomonadales bacterium]|nr:right-handed parallel beta-helix repeat-containing protein [Xanthomonadales bacterium]
MYRSFFTFFSVGAVIAGGIAGVAAVPDALAGGSTIMVDTLIDENPPNESDGLCSLREAAAAARLGMAVDSCAMPSSPRNIRFDGNVVPVDPATPFEINLVAPLNFDTQSSLTITLSGPLEPKLTVLLPPSTQASSPGFALPSNGGTLELAGLTLRSRGPAPALGAGQLIQSGDLTLRLTEVDLIGDGAPGSQGVSVISAGSVELDFERMSIRGFSRVGLVLQADSDVTLLVRDSQLVDNATAMSLELSQSAAVLGSIEDSTFSRNSSVAFFLGSTSDGGVVGLGIERSVFSDNAGGAISLRHFGDSLGLLNLRRNLLFANRSDRAAVISRGVRFIGANNTFIDNVSFDQGPGGLLVEDDSGSTVVVGNTFWGNSASREVTDDKGLIGAPLPQALRLQLADEADNGRFVGNLVVQREPSVEPTCLFGPQDGLSQVTPASAMHNASNVADCLVGDQELQIVDLASRVATGLTGDPRRFLAVFPELDSGVVDQWPDAECRVDSSLLSVDMIGDRRDESDLPLDGDPMLPADCDIGALELPKTPLTEEIFINGFE